VNSPDNPPGKLVGPTHPWPDLSRRRFLSGAAAILGAAGAGVILDACGGSSTGSAKGASSSGQTSGSLGPSGRSGTGGTLVIAMTASELPGLDTVGYQSQGGEGGRFVGVQLYDGLLKFNLLLSTAQHGNTGFASAPPPIIPGLASSYTVTPDATTWTFKLRSNVIFHDGTPWNADAAVFNIERMCDKSSPLYQPTLNSTGGIVVQSIASATKVDEMTVQVKTSEPWSYLPDQLCLLPFGSPTAIKRLGKTGFAEHPVGTGPFQFGSVSGTQKLVMKKNDRYYRGPAKLDEVVLLCTPEATARAAALEAGQVNWIEVPPPDSIPALRSNGDQVLTNAYSHIWPWVLDTTKGPLANVQVRQAMNYAIDRDTLCQAILDGTGRPALQYAPLNDPGYSPSLDTYSYKPAKAKQMLAAAGYPNGFSMTLSFPTSGSGNMVPIPMNEFLQKNLAQVGIKVKLQPIEWASMLTYFFNGKIPGGADAINISLGYVLPSLWYSWFGSTSPTNVGGYKSPAVDKLLDQAQAELDTTTRAGIFEQINAQLLKDSPWLIVCNDLNPRVLGPKVRGFVMPQSWYVDLTTTWIS
jgi:peptide/nickel transport system substrate-binding protein